MNLWIQLGPVMFVKSFAMASRKTHCRTERTDLTCAKLKKEPSCFSFIGFNKKINSRINCSTTTHNDWSHGFWNCNNFWCMLKVRFSMSKVSTFSTTWIWKFLSMVVWHILRIFLLWSVRRFWTRFINSSRFSRWIHTNRRSIFWIKWRNWRKYQSRLCWWRFGTWMKIYNLHHQTFFPQNVYTYTICMIEDL